MGVENPNQSVSVVKSIQRANLYPPIAVIDSAVDSVWGYTYVGKPTTGVNNPYFDYFFTGQDIIVTVDGTEDDDNFKVLPLLNLGFNVSQQKSPVYGFWSYTYDAMLRGTRLVQGSITLATKSPHYMTNLVAKAAQARQERLGSANYNYDKGLTEDDANIAKYWESNLDPTYQANGINLFSVHPPFSFVIIYGVQNVSVSEWGNVETYQQYIQDNPWLADTNERLIESDIVNQSNRVIIDAVDIQSMETSFDPDGRIIAETYNFLARDIIVPSYPRS